MARRGDSTTSIRTTWPPSSTTSISPAVVNAEERPAAHAGLALLQKLEAALEAALVPGDIKLLRADALRDEALIAALLRRQDLEALERSSGRAIFLTPDEAVAALRAGDRRLAALTYGWCTPGEPDPTGEYLAAVRRFLQSDLGAHVVGVFWDFGSLTQKPRTEAETAAFKHGLSGMSDLYASALGMMVIRHQRVPARPASFDGAVVVVAAAGGAFDGGDEAAAAAVQSALEAHGALDASVAVRRDEEGRWRATFASHAAAESVVREGVAGAAAVFCFYNERPYDERGWTNMESAVSTEAVAHAVFFPKLAAALARLPPKLVEIDGAAGPAVAAREEAAGGTGGGAGPRIERNRAKIRGAFFTSGADRDVVVKLYSEFITKIGNAMVHSGEGVKIEYEGGQNVAGQREGWGTVRYADGDVYVGEWKAGKREGWGTFSYAEGSVFEGNYKADKREGWGTYRYADGDVFEGDFKAGESEGRGTYRFANGNVFEGEFKAGKREGRGTYRYTDGTVETSHWKVNEPVGEGVQWMPGGQEAHRLRDGEPEEAISLEEARRTVARLGLPLPSEAASEYAGEYNAAGQKEGQGTERYANGDVHEGQWKADKKEGRGTYTYASGAVYEGEWKAGEREGRGAFRLPLPEQVARGVHEFCECDRSGMCPIVGFLYNLRGENYCLCQAEYDKLPPKEQSQYDMIPPPPPAANS